MWLKCVLFVLVNLVINLLGSRESEFVYHQVVSDVISKPPHGVLNVTFPGGAAVQLGNQLSIEDVSGTPTLHWEQEPGRYYTVVFCDADAPSRSAPEARSFLHWLVVNLPRSDVTASTTLTSLINSHPEPGTGLHRYIWLVYEQPGLVEFEEQPDDSFERRKGFSPEAFADKYSFGNAIAGNFYQTENLSEEHI